MTATTLKIETFFKERKCALPDIGMLQPADPILNAAGEDIRRRIFMTNDQLGRDLCLRPEFTIPVCLDHLQSTKEKMRYAYVGKVFRQRADEPAEFMQAGIEDIGAANAIAADAKSLLQSIELLRMLGKNRLSVTIGDQAIFEAVLTSLGLPKTWRERLLRAFGDKTRLSADLDRLSGETSEQSADLPVDIIQAIREKDSLTLTTFIESEMAKASMSSQHGRSSDEIAKRMMEKAELAETHLSDDKRKVLETFLALDLRLKNADRKLWSFARKFNIPLGDPLEDFHKRIVAIDKLGLENVAIRYKSAFGRRLDYYTGFVFEVNGVGKSAAKPLAGGGRYDGLLTVLGSKAKTPAIGFAVYVDRVVGPRGAA